MTMNNLPIEILSNIFIYTDLFDRIECTLVCRGWYHVLQEYSLFKNVDITDDEGLLECFLHLMEESPHYAAQVEELYVDVFVDSTVNKRTFVNTFPNARVIIVQWYGDESQVEEHCYYSKQIKNSHSKSKVKILHDMVYCELASQMLVTNTCDGLTELKLDFVNPLVVNPFKVIDELKNLPALRSLTLERCAIGLCTLERIHDSAPNLRELKLNDIGILGCGLPSPIIPAHSMTSIVININEAFPITVDESDNNDQDAEPFRLYARFYQYMSRKYPNLISMKHLNNKLFSSRPDQIRLVFLYGLLDLYRRILRPTTTKLNIQAVPNDINIFDICDENDCQIAELKAHSCDKENFFQHLIDSNQCNHIVKLKLIDTEIYPPSDLIRLESLQILNISFTRPLGPPTINLTDYLNGCPPSLKHFSIDCPHVKADPPNTNLSGIETLVISCRDPGPKVCKVISSSFPHLVELDITGTICIQKSIQLELHSPHLKRATFSYSRYPRYGCGFAFKSLDETEFQYYYISSRIKTAVTREKIQGLYTLTVTTLDKKRINTYNEITLLPL